MSSPFDDSEFVDADYQAAQSVSNPARGTSGGRPPTPEEINAKVSVAQQKLVELRAAQEELEREKSALEEIRRRRLEFRQGREEMIAQLVRGTGILEEATLAAKTELSQMEASLQALREAGDKVQALSEEDWTTDNLHIELSRALTTVENARMEWNTARLKWPVLNKAAQEDEGAGSPVVNTPMFGAQSFGQMCRIGFALNWPSAVLALILLIWLFLKN